MSYNEVGARVSDEELYRDPATSLRLVFNQFASEANLIPNSAKFACVI